MMNLNFHLILISLGCTACFDLGYEVLPPDASEEEPDAGAALDAESSADAAAPSCTEGPTAPSTSGVQIALVTLNVDHPIQNVKVGDVVTWTNTDTMIHTVTAGVPGAPQAAPLGFDSGDIAPNTKWAYRFCTARTAFYFCKTHANQMNGYRVVVTP
ncbi:MAG: hypothetical protein U1E65_01730 [Myxococcota bacterium]